MAKGGRPPASLDDWLDWQQRVASQKASGLSVEVYCLQEGISRSTFYRWQQHLKNSFPTALLENEADLGAWLPFSPIGPTLRFRLYR